MSSIKIKTLNWELEDFEIAEALKEYQANYEYITNVCPGHEPADTGIPGGTIWCRICDKDIELIQNVWRLK